MSEADISTTAEAHEASALPRAHAVLADPDATEAAELEPLPEALTRQPLSEKTPAQWAYERLIIYLQKFEEDLDSEHEIAVGFAGSDVGVLRIEGLGFFAPDIVTFYGQDGDGQKLQLIQHVSQLNVMLSAVPKTPGDGQARRIGFRLVQDLENDGPTAAPGAANA